MIVECINDSWKLSHGVSADEKGIKTPKKGDLCEVIGVEKIDTHKWLSRDFYRLKFYGKTLFLATHFVPVEIDISDIEIVSEKPEECLV